MKKVIIINGPAGVGKDEFINQVRNAGEALQLPVFSFSSVDRVKEAAIALGWDGIKTPETRQLLQDLKQISIQRLNDGPTRYLLEQIANVEHGLIFLHIREPQEIEKIMHFLPETLRMHVDRPGIERLVNGADDVTRDTQYDFELNNDGTLEDLYLMAVEFVQRMASIESESNIDFELR